MKQFKGNNNLLYQKFGYIVTHNSCFYRFKSKFHGLYTLSSIEDNIPFYKGYHNMNNQYSHWKYKNNSLLYYL